VLFIWYSGSDDKKEYLVKWKELPYDECYWELESDISAFQIEIERFNTFQSRSREGSESNNLQKEFVQYENSPQFLSGGMYFDRLILPTVLCIILFNQIWTNLITCIHVYVYMKVHCIHINLKD